MHYLYEDITKVKGPCVIAHGVNCLGNMNSGVARSLFERWPEVKSEYMKVHRSEGWTLGKVRAVDVGDGITVLNCATQERHRKRGDRPNEVYAERRAIHNCLLEAANFCRIKGAPILYAPKIGCGLGGLTWENVAPIFERVEEDMGIGIVVCTL
jgi:O-acetyl-ADP-ribose deacetylase (regulator of RNase III)